MDSDTTYRMIVSFGLFVIGIIVTGLLWPRKTPQNHYDSPLLRVQPRIRMEELPEKDICPLCQWKNHNDMNNKYIDRILLLINRHQYTMCNHELTEMICKYYESKVYMKEGYDMKLKSSTVLEHIEGKHSLSANQFIVDSIREHQKIKTMASESMFLSDDKVDHNAFRLFQKAQENLESLYNMPAIEHVD